MKNLQDLQDWAQKNSTVVIVVVVAVVAVFTAISMFFNTLELGEDIAGYQKVRAKYGLQKNIDEWPQPFQDLYQEFQVPSAGEIKMSVCWALGKWRGDDRVMICKIEGWRTNWRKLETKLNLQRVGNENPFEWQINPSSLKKDMNWWPKLGESAIFFASKNFLDGAKDDFFQVARMENGPIYIHYTLKKEPAELK